MLRSLSDIQAFVRVAHTLNFTRAAAELHVTPTAISKAVARLEKDLDVSLFTRSTRHVQLTDEGELFLGYCQAAFADIEAGLVALEVLRDETVGTVRLSAPFILGRRLAASLPRLFARHPKLDLRLTLTDTYVDLGDDRVDIAIRIGDAKVPDAQVVPLSQLNWVTVASPRYLEVMGPPESLSDLKDHRCHHFVNSAGAIVPWNFVRDGQTVSMAPGGGAELNQGELLIEVALADGGIVQVFNFMVAEALQTGELNRLFADFEAEGPVVSALTLPGRQVAPKIRATLRHLAELFDSPESL